MCNMTMECQERKTKRGKREKLLAGFRAGFVCTSEVRKKVEPASEKIEMES